MRMAITWNGSPKMVSFVYPELDAVSHSLKVRLSVPNFSGELEPNLLATVSIAGQPVVDVLKIPTEALIVTGERNAVIVALGDGKFRPVDVVFGLLPMMIGQGAGSEVLQRIATPILGGMITAPLLSLFIIPIVYLHWKTRKL